MKAATLEIANTCDCPKIYKITKLFIGGLLKDLTYTENTTVNFEVGFECRHPVGGSPYRIIAVEPVGD